MAKAARRSETTEELIRDLMIVQLGIAGVGQREIREIVGVDLNRVTKIVRHLKKSKPQ